MIGDTLASSFCHCKAQDFSFYSEQAPQSPRILPGKYGGRELEGGENSPSPRPSPVKGEGISAGLATPEPALSGEILPLHFIQGQNDRKAKGLAMMWGRARAEQRIVRVPNLGSP